MERIHIVLESAPGTSAGALCHRMWELSRQHQLIVRTRFNGLEFFSYPADELSDVVLRYESVKDKEKS